MKQMESRPGVLHVETLGDTIVISPEGACDDECAEALDGLISHIKNGPEKDIVLDASKLKYIESSGFRWMIDHFRKLQDVGRSLVVVGLAGPAERAFKLLQLDKFIPAASSIEAALARIRHNHEASKN